MFRKYLAVAFILVMTTVLAFGIIQAQTSGGVIPLGSPWPMDCNDTNCTGHNNDDACKCTWSCGYTQMTCGTWIGQHHSCGADPC